jgi:hypothetical protein
MGCGRCQDGLRLAEAAINLLKALQEARHRRSADSDVVADGNVALAQFAGNDLHAFVCCRVFDPEQVPRQRCAEAAVDLADRACGDGASVQAAGIDPLLDGDMRLRFELEVALFGVAAIVAFQRTLDIDWVRVVAFDQVAVVAVHRTHERRKGGQQAFRQRAAETGATLGQFKRKIGQFCPVARALAQHERLHQGNAFAPVFCRFYVRFSVRFVLGHESI